MKTALIIALVCLIIGAILVGAGWVVLQKHPTEKNTLKDSVYPYGMDKLPKQINISTLDSRVELRSIEGDEWRVECKETENNPHTVELIDGVLTVKQEGDVRKWYEYIGILNAFQNPSVIVYLPAQIYESLSIHSASGSIKVQEGFTFSNASLQNTSGSISCVSRVTGALNVKNTSGSITVSGNVGSDLIAKNTSGSITVNGSVGGDLTATNTSGSIHVLGGVNGKLEVTNGSGSITIKNATPTSAKIKNTSGGIDLIDVVCSETCEIDNTSGSIELERCDAASFDLHTTSGGIRASLLSPKTFDCHTTSGSVNVPADGNGGTFKARTTSGGIRITIVE